MNFTEDIWLGIISTIMVVILISGALIFYMKHEPSKMFKNALIWFGLIVFLVFIYSFKNDFGQIKQRFVGELMPSKAQINNGEIQIRKSENGHFQINAEINNQNIKFLVDTGASDVVIPVNIAKELGINIEQLSFNRAYNTANGRIFAAPFKIDMMEISGIRFYDIPASVSNSNLLTPLLGMSFLRKLKEYRISGNILTLVPQ